jgi:hypothetical protein
MVPIPQHSAPETNGSDYETGEHNNHSRNLRFAAGKQHQKSFLRRLTITCTGV